MRHKAQDERCKIQKNKRHMKRQQKRDDVSRGKIYKCQNQNQNMKDKITKPLIRVFIIFQIVTFIAFLA